MDIRKTIAGVALAGTLAFTGMSAASAQTDPPASPSAHPKVTCEVAVHKVATWQARLDHFKARIADLRVRRDRLVAAGKLDQAKQLTDIIQSAEPFIDAVQARLTTIEQKVRERCGPDATSTPAPDATASQ